MIAIVDYEAGNLRSVEKALSYLDVKTIITDDEKKIKTADAVILPGVGAFSDCIFKLKEKGMDQTIKEVIKEGKPFLGICLGFQMLFETSEEGKSDRELVKGLGILKGSVKKFPDSNELKVPQMGWNCLDIKIEEPFFKKTKNNPYVYFVHSYYVDSADKSIVAATCDYGINFDAAVKKDNIFAVQFHPEKSGAVGLSILKQFADNI